MTAMDAGQRAAEVEGKGQKERRADVLHWLVGFNRRSGLGTIAAVCLAELATDAV